MSTDGPENVVSVLAKMSGPSAGFKPWNFWARKISTELTRDESVRLLGMVYANEAQKHNPNMVMVETIRKGENKAFSYELLSLVMKQFEYPPPELKQAILNDDEEKIKEIINNFPTQVIEALQPIYAKVIDSENVKFPLEIGTMSGDKKTIANAEEYKEFKNKEFVTSVIFGPIVSFIEADLQKEKPQIKSSLNGKYFQNMRDKIIGHLENMPKPDPNNPELSSKVDSILKSHQELAEKSKAESIQVNEALKQCAFLYDGLPEAQRKECKDKIDIVLRKHVEALDKQGSIDIKSAFLDKAKETFSEEFLNKTLIKAVQTHKDNNSIQLFIDMGANPNLKTSDYQRNGITRFTDTVKGLFNGKGLKFWNKAPERSIQEIAVISGSKDLVSAINRVEQERKVINQEVDPKIIKSLDDSLPPQISSSNANLLSRTPPFTQLKDQIDQQLPLNATPLQAFQHDVGMMLSQIKKEIESVEKDDPFSAKMLKIDAKQLESIREVLASPQTDATTLIGKIDDIVIKAEGERKAANNNLAPVHSKTTMNMLNMVEKHQGKMSVPVEPEKEVIARRSPTAKNS